MTPSQPRTMYAGDRETGVPCVQCGVELKFGERTAVCQVCGNVHHASCWQELGRCRSYDCSLGTTSMATTSSAVKISSDDLAAAQPVVVAQRPFDPHAVAPSVEQPAEWNRTAVWSLIIAVAGIALFGLITGLVAMVLGAIALVAHRSRQRGLGLAVAAILLGLVDVVGWAVGISLMLGGTGVFDSPATEFAAEPASMENLPDHLNRAMRANVLIQCREMFGTSIGSGVILRQEQHRALIVTNRHVVDSGFADDSSSATEISELTGVLSVQALGQLHAPARVEWIAPDGIDLAVISAPLVSDDIRTACWYRQPQNRIGDSVFAVGNPHGLGWTHTSGDISQIRQQTGHRIDYRVIQTSAAINSGNSGGGLYDAEGNLIGINTWTQDKRYAEGLGFSIELPALLQLVPESLGIPQEQRPAESDDGKKDSDASRDQDGRAEEGDSP